MKERRGGADAGPSRRDVDIGDGRLGETSFSMKGSSEPEIVEELRRGPRQGKG